MNKIIRNIFIVILLLVLLLAFNTSYTSLNIDNLAYVVALGIDIGEENNYKFTFQFVPRKTSSDSESSSGENNSTVVNTVDAPSINTAINLLNSFIAREINLSHCKVIVFSEAVASQGVEDLIYTLTNDSQVRLSANIIVCKNKAQNYIEESNPILENLITKYYEIFPNSTKYTGYIYNATLGEFFNQLVSKTGEPIAILGGVNYDADSNIASNSSLEGFANIKSTDTTFAGFTGSENVGVAVFKEDKLVGELTAVETLCLSGIKSEVQSFLIRIPNPYHSGDEIDLIMYPLNSNKYNVDIINGTPYISFSEKFIGRIYSTKANGEYLNSKVLENISEVASRYLSDIIINYLYKTSINFEADINEFGKYALSNFLTMQEFEDYDWKNNYKNATFNVNIKAEIQSGFLITET